MASINSRCPYLIPEILHSKQKEKTLMILLINACVRKNSRTRKLAGRLLSRLNEPVEEVRLQDISFPAVDEAFLDRRDTLLRSGRLDDPMFSLARQFAGADRIVIAAPYWDHSFPAALKQYLEQVCVVGVTFRYDEQGISRGLCKAGALYYVSTAGGAVCGADHGFRYVKTLAELFFGIPDVRQFRAEHLDEDPEHADDLLAKAMEDIDREMSLSISGSSSQAAFPGSRPSEA